MEEKKGIVINPEQCNRAVECVGTYIGKKGLKKMIDEGTI